MKILLATDSELYLPLYLAWLNSDLSLRSRIDFSTNKQQHDGQNNDNLIKKTLSQDTPHNDILFAVGDLERLRGASSHSYSNPIITAGFIDKMCLWMIATRDHSKQITKPESNQEFSILTHSRHMTTFKAAQKIVSQKYQGRTQIHPVMNPGIEEKYFKSYGVICRLSKRPITYITPDIMSSINAKNNNCEVVENFLLEYNKNISMTGFFTSQENYTDYKSVIDDFQDNVRSAISKLYRDPNESAWILSKYSKDMQAHCDFPIAFDRRRLGVLIRNLKDKDPYSENLAVYNCQLENRLLLDVDMNNENRTEILKYMKGINQSVHNPDSCPASQDEIPQNFRTLPDRFMDERRPEINTFTTPPVLQRFNILKFANRSMYLLMSAVAFYEVSLAEIDRHLFFPREIRGYFTQYLEPSILSVISLAMMGRDVRRFVSADPDSVSWQSLFALLSSASLSTYVLLEVFLGKGDSWSGDFVVAAGLAWVARWAVIMNRFPSRKVGIFNRIGGWCRAIYSALREKFAEISSASPTATTS